MTLSPSASPWPQLGPADAVDALGDDDLDMLPVAGVAAIGAGAVPPAHPVARSPRNFNLERLSGPPVGCAAARCAGAPRVVGAVPAPSQRPPEQARERTVTGHKE